MHGKSKVVTLAAAAAMTGLVIGSSMSSMGCQKNAGSSSPDVKATHACKGQNACKGQGGCKTDTHACKGQNACKGQGGCKAA